MKPSTRKTRKWRKASPMVHRSHAEKRDRQTKQIREEIRKAKRGDDLDYKS